MCLRALRDFGTLLIGRLDFAKCGKIIESVGSENGGRCIIDSIGWVQTRKNSSVYIYISVLIRPSRIDLLQAENFSPAAVQSSKVERPCAPKAAVNEPATVIWPTTTEPCQKGRCRETSRTRRRCRQTLPVLLVHASQSMPMELRALAECCDGVLSPRYNYLYSLQN